MENKLPISVFVVSKNEGHLLANCLNSISPYCSETIVIDLKSADTTLLVAQKHKAKILTIEPVPLVEIIHSRYIEIAKNNWVLICDPDEVLTSNLVMELKNIFTNQIEKLDLVGEISSPWRFYFKGKKLKGTIWGGINFRTLLIHKKRFKFTELVHQGRALLNGYSKMTISEDNNQHINHYWMQSYSQLINKHNRYLKNEGRAKYESGETTNIKKIIKKPFKIFKQSYFKKEGYKDGFVGLFLSVFAAWYFTSAEMELYKYSRKSKVIKD
ncbi:hypothetical protein [Pedobacter sp. SL55]|uniref:hypothetical protein n=1 Tax=Pedobacter sp. SL55 TaxID=2995161 RepID=UPI0022718254|nr:hypothetical protein [Pedobacter sp. SL55]WAC41745.1 hypothetical protein OVA16_05115 [Pedobacter sp. SL55]